MDNTARSLKTASMTASAVHPGRPLIVVASSSFGAEVWAYCKQRKDLRECACSAEITVARLALRADLGASGPVAAGGSEAEIGAALLRDAAAGRAPFDIEYLAVDSLA